MQSIEFWFEFGSTYSYPAAMRIGQLAAARGIAVAWRAFLLGPIFREQGWSDSPFNLQPVKGRYMWRDLERICAALGLPLRRPTQFPRNGLLAARIACWFEAEPWLPEFVRGVYHANFAADQDIGTPAVIGSVLEALAQPAGQILAAAAEPAAKDKLRHRTEQASALGIFGAPSVVAGGELFWGNDRLETALAWAAADRPQ